MFDDQTVLGPPWRPESGLYFRWRLPESRAALALRRVARAEIAHMAESGLYFRMSGLWCRDSGLSPGL
jgi:hypothetical protein